MIYIPININSSTEEDIDVLFKLLWMKQSAKKMYHVFLFDKEIFEYLCKKCKDIMIYWYCECNTSDGNHFHYHLIVSYDGDKKYETWKRSLRSAFPNSKHLKKDRSRKSEWRLMTCIEHLTQVIHYVSCSSGSNFEFNKIEGKKHIHNPILCWDKHNKTKARAAHNCDKVRASIRRWFETSNNIICKEHNCKRIDNKLTGQFRFTYECFCVDNVENKLGFSKSIVNHFEDVDDETVEKELLIDEEKKLDEPLKKKTKNNDTPFYLQAWNKERNTRFFVNEKRNKK